MATDVVALTDDLLDLVVSSLTDPPKRRYVGHHEPAFDCEQVTVHLARMRPKVIDTSGSGDLRQVNCALVWVAVLVVNLVRCVTALKDDGTPPDADLLDDEYQALLGEGVDFARAISTAWRDKTWPAGLACGQVTFGNLEPVPPQGGLAGWRMTVEVQL